MTSSTILLTLFAIIGLTYGITTIEFLFDEADQPGDGDLLIEDSPQVSSFIRRAQKICVNGMWGLYDTTVYGESDAEGSKVVAVHGNSRFDCTNVSVAETMENVYSFRRLGSPVLTTELLEYYQLSNFRFNATVAKTQVAATLTEANARLVKSFALTGSTYYWRACNGTTAVPGYCVCLDTVINAPFLVPDLDHFPPNTPLRTIGVFDLITKAVCATLERPIGDAPLHLF